MRLQVIGSCCFQFHSLPDGLSAGDLYNSLGSYSESTQPEVAVDAKGEAWQANTRKPSSVVIGLARQG